MADAARFAAWCARRLFARERIVLTLALLAGAAAGPVLVWRYGALGWIWIGVVAVVATGFLAALVISYLKVRLEDARRRSRADQLALVAEHLGRHRVEQDQRLAALSGRIEQEGQARASLGDAVAGSEKRLTAALESRIARVGQDQAAALSQILRLRSDQADTLRTALRAEISAAHKDALSALEARTLSTREESEALAKAVNDRMEALARQVADQQGQALERLRLEIETVSATHADTARNLADRLETVSRQMAESQAAGLAALRAETETLLGAHHAQAVDRLDQIQRAQSEAAGEAQAYLRRLIDRRVRAGGEAVMAEIARLRQDIEPSLQKAVRGAAAAGQLRDGLAAATERLDSLDVFKADAERSIAGQSDSIAAVNKRSAQEIASVREMVEKGLAEERTAREAAVKAVSEEQAGAVPVLEARLADLRKLLDQKMGPEFEARLDEWRNRLDNEIVSAVQQGRTEDLAAAQQREAKLRAELAALHQDILKHREEAATKEEVGAVAATASRARKASDAVEARLTAAAAEVERRVQEQIKAVSESAKAGQAKATTDASEAARAAAASAAKAIESRLSAIEAAGKDQSAQLQEGLRKVQGVQTSGPALSKLEKDVADLRSAQSGAPSDALRKLSDANATIARPFDRLLAPDILKRLEQHWLKTFGVNMSKTALAYMAHKICLLEDRGMGRIAAPIETIVMRQLALRSLPNRGKLEVLEIGNLFGLSAAVLYNFRGARSAGMHLTLLDPLEGYYEAGGLDPVTGVEVCEDVLRKNLADLDVPASDYRLIKALSADPRAISAVSDRLYDYVLVDGDHSTAGVAADFENYGPLVKPGGLMIFDDYGSDHWPGIQPYVDETVRTDPNWIWIGADYRTAVVAKKADGATARIAPRTNARKPAARRPARA